MAGFPNGRWANPRLEKPAHLKGASRAIIDHLDWLCQSPLTS